MKTPVGVRYTIADDYPDHLKDESRHVGHAGSISFPADERELQEHLIWAAEEGLPLTVQGARTGITGGAVPEGGHVLSLWRMRRFTGLRRHPDGERWLLRVQPGVLLSDVKEGLRNRDFDTHGWSSDSLAAYAAFERSPECFFPPDLTETGASLGGVAANNGSGARSYRYGAARRSIHAARLALVDGQMLALERGTQRVEGGHFSVSTESGRCITGVLPSYPMPDVKCATGYTLNASMDMLDLFIGSEGTLGMFTELELELQPLPGAMWGVTCFLPSEDAALSLVERVRSAALPTTAAIEFFDQRVLNLLRRQQTTNPAFSDLPPLADDWHTALYIEIHATDADAAETAVIELSELMVACGGDPDATWLADNEREIDRVKVFRHAAPECVNMLIDERRRSVPELTKLGTDLAVPDASLREVMRMYHNDLDAAGLEYVIFGHIGDNHVHVNIIPSSLEAYERGKELYREWAGRVVALGGAVSAEHGIGKLKRELLHLMVGDEGIDAMKSVKSLFDPERRLGAGNLWLENPHE